MSVGVDLNEEKLLGLIVLEHDLELRLMPTGGEAAFRAFIVQNRSTGEVGMNFRWRYADGKDWWYRVKPKNKRNATESFRELRDTILNILATAAEAMGVEVAESDLRCYEPPEDDGDVMATVRWLVHQDLVHQPIDLAREDAR